MVQEFSFLNKSPAGSFADGLTTGKQLKQQDTALNQGQQRIDQGAEVFDNQKQMQRVEMLDGHLNKALESAYKMIEMAQTPETKAKAIELFKANAAPALEQKQLLGVPTVQLQTIVDRLGAQPTGEELRQRELSNTMQETRALGGVKNDLAIDRQRGMIDAGVAKDPNAPTFDRNAQMEDILIQGVMNQLMVSGLSEEEAKFEAVKRVKGKVSQKDGKIYDELSQSFLNEEPIDEPIGGAIESQNEVSQPTAFEQIQQAVGAVDSSQQMLNNIPLVNQLFFEEKTSEAVNAINVFNKSAEKAFINNDKYPVAEQKKVAEMLPKTGFSGFFQDDRDAINKLENLKSFTENKVKMNRDLLKDDNLSKSDKSKLTRHVAELENILERLGSPDHLYLKYVPPQAIADLKDNPDLAKDFDAFYGKKFGVKNMSKVVLGE